jgi:hypothetical protein
MLLIGSIDGNRCDTLVADSSFEHGRDSGSGRRGKLVGEGGQRPPARPHTTTASRSCTSRGQSPVASARIAPGGAPRHSVLTQCSLRFRACLARVPWLTACVVPGRWRSPRGVARRRQGALVLPPLAAGRAPLRARGGGGGGRALELLRGAAEGRPLHGSARHRAHPVRQTSGSSQAHVFCACFWLCERSLKQPPFRSATK